MAVSEDWMVTNSLLVAVTGCTEKEMPFRIGGQNPTRSLRGGSNKNRDNSCFDREAEII
jgi:hypothetical protein